MKANVTNVQNAQNVKSQIAIENVVNSFDTLSRADKKAYKQTAKVVKSSNMEDINSAYFWAKFIAEKYLNSDKDIQYLVNTRLSLKKNLKLKKDELKQVLFDTYQKGVPFISIDGIVCNCKSIQTNISESEIKFEYKFIPKGKITFGFFFECLFNPKKQRTVLVDEIDETLTKIVKVIIQSNKVTE